VCCRSEPQPPPVGFEECGAGFSAQYGELLGDRRGRHVQRGRSRSHGAVVGQLSEHPKSPYLDHVVNLMGLVKRT
jgi:hypothetical protein